MRIGSRRLRELPDDQVDLAPRKAIENKICYQEIVIVRWRPGDDIFAKKSDGIDRRR